MLSVLNTGFPYSILNTDLHDQDTELFSLKSGSPYIHFLFRKNFGSVFFAFRAVLFYLYFFSKNFRFSVFSWHLLWCGHIVSNPKLNRVKNGLPVLFAKKYGINTKYGFLCSILNTDQHRQNTEFFSLKHWSPYIDINRLEKNFGFVFFAFRAVLFYLYFF